MFAKSIRKSTELKRLDLEERVTIETVGPKADRTVPLISRFSMALPAAEDQELMCRQASLVMFGRTCSSHSAC